MSANGSMTRIYVFVLILNLVFPVLGYTFTTFGSEYEDYDITLDLDSLMMAGINLADAQSHNVTWKGEWVYFEVLNKTTRFKFMEWTWFGGISGDGIHAQKRTPISIALNNWISVYRVGVQGYKTGNKEKAIYNASIITEWESEYNWSRFLLTEGTNIFITPFSGDNITKSVFEDGTLNITLAQVIEETSTFNFRNFVGWYSSLILGTQAWGLPVMFAWFIRILGAISVFAVVMLTKELIKL